MPRRPRIHLNDVPLHIVQRGHNRERTSYRANGLGQPDAILTTHLLCLPLGEDGKARQSAYRALFRSQLDKAAVDGIRLALGQNQPLGNERFYSRIEKLTGQRREAKPRGRPRALAGEYAAAGSTRRL
ncbi:MAG: hypothetical protein HY937_06575 [Nitrosomonadales bacterium]|nr:hypothetical protein [Nitrosomonadales bacterium]